MNYRALFFFISDNGTPYKEDELITEAEFENLPVHEQMNFTPVYIEPVKLNEL